MGRSAIEGTSSDPIDSPTSEWRTLSYFNFYRVILGGLLASLAFADIAPAGPDSSASLFAGLSLSYVAVGILCSFWIRWRRPGWDLQVFVQVCADIAIITLLTHAAGGLTSGFGLLMVVAVAGGSILVRGRIAIFFAALASMAVLGEQLIASRLVESGAEGYTHAGVLGAVFFGAAGLAHLSAKRIRTSEALVAKRDLDLRNLAELNQYIIRRMQSGILVVSTDARVVLSNDSSHALLGVEGGLDGRSLAELVPSLYERFVNWRTDRERPSYTFQAESSGLEVTASFAALGFQDTAAIVFLEDASVMTQRAQQLKLASLGRLTASIAHEIRNPLGAISHAGQLLDESNALNAADRRLSEIIQDNCQRVNGIIEDVLGLSRRNPAVPESVAMGEWLRVYVEAHNVSEVERWGALEAFCEFDELVAPFDPNQLQQVVSNLVENGLRHSPQEAQVRLVAGLHTETQRPYLDIIDEGRGIPAPDREHVFEPFFTTRADGTGLGLYIARELCEANQASLRLLDSDLGCHFRITFADPRRRVRAAMTQEMPA